MTCELELVHGPEVVCVTVYVPALLLLISISPVLLLANTRPGGVDVNIPEVYVVGVLFGEPIHIVFVGYEKPALSWLTVTARLVAVAEPQALVGTTEIVPPVELAVALIELVVDEPVHPEGNVHIYEVTFGSFVTV